VSAQADLAARRRIVIEPRGGWAPLRLDELWEYRELLFFLIWRDVKVRYKQTALGASWAVLQPALTTVVFALFFGRLAHVPSEGVPYTLFSLSALVLWTFFSQAVGQGAQSLVSVSNMVSKVYFPRLLVPAGAALSFLVDLAISFAILIVVVLAYGRGFDLRALLVLPFVLLTAAAALAATVWLAGLNVRYRDVKYAVPFLLQLWLFVSPVAYPSSLLSGAAKVAYGLNPMAGAIDGFRWALLGTPAPPLSMLVASTAVTLVALVSGLFYFRRVESTFADVI
jgi:lipopolysaccharide transport system permease protein